MKDDMECRQEQTANEASSPQQSRHRSITMGAVPHENLMPYSPTFFNKNCEFLRIFMIISSS